MSLSREAIQEIKKGAAAEVIQEFGRSFIVCDGEVKEIPAFRQGELKLSTLDGIVDYITKDTDKPVHENNLTIVIESPTKVSVYMDLNERLERVKVLNVSAIVPEIDYGYGMDSERFIVNMLTNYLETDTRNKIIETVSNISDEEEAKTTDDGISQTVVLKKGVKKEEGTIKNPVRLRPICTFTEVEQPERPFIFRIKNAGSMCLHKGNDTIWINQAKKRIGSYLEDELKDYPVKIIL